MADLVHRLASRAQQRLGRPLGSDGVTWLPQVSWGTKPVASRSAIENSAQSAQERQLTLAADGGPLRVIYGTDRVGAQIANMLISGGYWVIQCIWGEGEIDDIGSPQINDATLPAGAQVTHYLGTAGQTVDPWMVTAAAAKGVTYADTLPNIAYSVLRVPTGDVTDMPQVAAIIRGRKLYDPRTTLTAYSSNPALALADMLGNTRYGGGRTIDWASVTTTANACDATVGGAPRRTLNLTISGRQELYALADTLRTYTGCWIVPGDDGLRLVPDRPGTSIRHYDHSAGMIRSIGALRRAPLTEQPTVMTVRYTDTGVTPWIEGRVTVYADGVLSGTTPRRESDISLPGVQTAAQATREAVERLNKLKLCDLSFDLDVFDDGLAVEPGDIVTVSHPVGLSAKAMRVLRVSGEHGRYTLALHEYDAAAYSDAVVSEPSTPDTSLPSPSAPVPVTDLALVEEVFQQQDGTYSSRIRATWTAPDFPATFMEPYQIRVTVGGSVVFTGTASADATEWASPSVQEGVQHQVDVVTVSRTGASSSATSATITAQGKQLAPGNVPSLTGFEVGGEVRLSWAPAVDLDIWRYEIRYGVVSGAWGDGILLDRTDSLRFTTRDVPAGDWAFMVKAVDSVGQYSATEARRTITVTLDSSAFLVDSYEFDTPTLSGMAEYSLGRTDTVRRFITEDGVALSTKFSADLSTYTQPLASYNTTASSLTTESEDFGLSLSGNWRAEATVTDIVGAHDAYLDVGPDGSAWTAYPMVAKTTGRFARVRIEAASGEVMQIDLPASVRIDAVPRSEKGESTSLASGGKTITLAGDYAAVKSLTITPLGTSARSCAVDNIVAGDPTTFDVYLFDSTSGAQVAGGFRWTFEGV